ncbi:hypothetical protein GE09DRAFT_1085775 [Coniochaeta sp. 2T2.1]|nr:hypothetical protein GE09DRAFT_1085775 [Coniochaeta sp. 2T2.1]
MTPESSMSKSHSEAGKSRPVRRREKYTPRACEKCKTRKVKCSGAMPCSRCLELGVECVYQESFPETASESILACGPGRIAKRRRTSTFSNPELGQLVLAMRKVCDDIESSTTSNDDSAAFSASSLKRSRRHAVENVPKVVHPTSGYTHLLGLARDVLMSKGFLEASKSRPHPKKPAKEDGGNVTNLAEDILQAAKPILHFGHDRAFQYLATFKDHIYTAYPCISLTVAAERMSALYSASLPPAGGNKFEDPGLDLIDVEMMKVTFAIAMTLEGENDNPLCLDLTAHLLWNVDVHMNDDQPQVEDVIIATLLSIYWILKNEPLKAWRMIGFAATTSLELGLHRENPSEKRDQAQAFQSCKIFPCVYDLDKRCSFFANLPWTLHDKDIDANVMSLDGQHPFLAAMLGLDRVHTEITRFNGAVSPSGSKETSEQTEIFDYRIQKLVDNIFEKGLFPFHTPDTPSPAVQTTMSSILRLRSNQVRMQAYTRYLSNAWDGSSYQNQAICTVVSLAKSSVDIYMEMHRASLLWRPLADRLLVGSVSCMFLVASQNPSEYGPPCRTAFQTAIDRLEQSSYELNGSESEVWNSLDDLRKLGGKIQMPPLDESTAADAPPPSYFDSSTVFNGDLDFSTEELAQFCDNTNQDLFSGLQDGTTLWDSFLQSI